MKKNNYVKTKNLYKIIFLFVVFLGIGYAFLEANLKVEGNTTVTAPVINAYIQSVTPTETSVSATTTIVGNDKNEISIEPTSTFSSPYVADITVTNQGTESAHFKEMVETASYSGSSQTSSLFGYYSITLTYPDGTAVYPSDVIAPGQTQTYRLTISAKDNNTKPPFTINVKLTYERNLFAEESWATIVDNIQNDTIPDYYTVGKVHPITLTKDFDNDGEDEEKTFHVRISNTTPCDLTDTSKSRSACGFVLEFIDVIEKRRINPCDTSITADGNCCKGGWEYSELRNYLNNDILDALPNDLKTNIIDTRVISGPGKGDTSDVRFDTIDKLYIPSLMELYGECNLTYYDRAYHTTRRLDYYAAKNVDIDQQYNKKNPYIKYYGDEIAVW